MYNSVSECMELTGKGAKRLEKVEIDVPISENTWFHAKLQSGNCVQIPVLVRWKFKLEPSEVLKVKVSPVRSRGSETFFARLQKGGRITVPTRVATFLELKPGDVVDVGLLAEKPAEK